MKFNDIEMQGEGLKRRSRGKRFSVARDLDYRKKQEDLNKSDTSYTDHICNVQLL